VIRLVIDDAAWAPDDVASEDLEDALHALADLLLTSTRRGERVGFYVDLWNLEVVGSHTLSMLLHDADNPRALGRDVRRRLARLFDELSSEAFDETALPALEVDIRGVRLLSPASVYAWSAAAERRVVGCITPATSARSGRLPVGVDGRDQPVHFVTDEPTHVAMFRDAIRTESADEDAFVALAASAFPELVFVDGVFRGLRDLSRPYRDRRDDLILHFSVLSDHGAAIFALEHNARIEAEFMSRKITISRETRETIADGRCRRARERTHAGAAFVFEWHTKIELHLDRIHVHPGVAASGGKIMVGIIHRHLPLPGD
jgi:hypothetical protein